MADYFSMLSDELAGKPYNKAAHNRSLQELIGRSKGSIEFKHQNISAVLKGLGETWVNGYKPAFNFQMSLVDAVARQLSILRSFEEQAPAHWGFLNVFGPTWAKMILRDETFRGIPGLGHVFIRPQVDPYWRSDRFQCRIGPFLPLLANSKNFLGAGLLVIQDSGLGAECAGLRANLAGRHQEMAMKIPIGPRRVEKSGHVFRLVHVQFAGDVKPFFTPVQKSGRMDIGLNGDAIFVPKPQRKSTDKPDLLGQR